MIQIGGIIIGSSKEIKEHEAQNKKTFNKIKKIKRNWFTTEIYFK